MHTQVAGHGQHDTMSCNHVYIIGHGDNELPTDTQAKLYETHQWQWRIVDQNTVTHQNLHSWAWEQSTRTFDKDPFQCLSAVQEDF